MALPGDGQSFALIYSIEDPAGGKSTTGVGAQVMGPDDGYLVQFSPDPRDFWANRDSLELGAVFKAAATQPPQQLKRPLAQVRQSLRWLVSTGRQAGGWTSSHPASPTDLSAPPPARRPALTPVCSRVTRPPPRGTRAAWWRESRAPRATCPRP